MTFEERLACHEQWLHSVESNHLQIAQDLARVERAQAAFAEHMVVVGQNQALFMANLARLGEESIELKRESIELKRELRELRDLVDRYIRGQGNGTPSN